MTKEKTTGFYFKCSPEEMKWIEKGMARTGITNKSAYLRKMAIDGHVFNLNMPEFNEIGRLLRINANNVNQIARKVNSGGSAYREDVAELNRQLAEVREEFGRLLYSLTELTNSKPGKHFVKPPTIRDLPEYNQNRREPSEAVRGGEDEQRIAANVRHQADEAERSL